MDFRFLLCLNRSIQILFYLVYSITIFPIVIDEIEEGCAKLLKRRVFPFFFQAAIRDVLASIPTVQPLMLFFNQNYSCHTPQVWLIEYDNWCAYDALISFNIAFLSTEHFEFRQHILTVSVYKTDISVFDGIWK